MKLLEIMLEYIKALIWPVMLLLAFFFYGNDLIKIVGNREINIFGVQIGNSIDDFSSNYLTELAALKDEIQNKGFSKADLLERIEAMELNAGKELSQVRSVAQQGDALTKANKKEQVSIFERDGFEAILNQDVISAIDAFTAARSLWPEYHNVAEVRKLLVKHQANLIEDDNQAEWRMIIEKVTQKYSWGIPSDLREKLAESIR